MPFPAGLLHVTPRAAGGKGALVLNVRHANFAPVRLVETMQLWRNREEAIRYTPWRKREEAVPSAHAQAQRVTRQSTHSQKDATA